MAEHLVAHWVERKAGRRVASSAASKAGWMVVMRAVAWAARTVGKTVAQSAQKTAVDSAEQMAVHSAGMLGATLVAPTVVLKAQPRAARKAGRRAASWAEWLVGKKVGHSAAA